MSINTNGDSLDPPVSILDTDLYKLTMQQAVLEHFPDVVCTYWFTNRTKAMLFNEACIERVKASVHKLSELQLTTEERKWLETACPYFKSEYLDKLAGLRLRPDEQVKFHYAPSEEDPSWGQLEITVEGLWWQTILYEVPVMSLLSQAYFEIIETDWSYEGQLENAYEKGKALLLGDVAFSEFGTRRRRSYNTHLLVMKGLIKARDEFEGKTKGKLTGTSNVHFARLFGVTPVGTIAHEWTMGIAALRGYEHVNARAMDLWEETYPTTLTNALHIALTDTFSSDVFFKDYVQDVPRAKRWRGLRQDSGDPVKYTYRAKEVLDSIGVDSREKIIIYSDGLDVPKCLELQKIAQEVGFIPAFGIGTSFTNDFIKRSRHEKSKPLNIVIKLSSVNHIPCVKISDEVTKNTGDFETVVSVKKRLGLPIEDTIIRG